MTDEDEQIQAVVNAFWTTRATQTANLDDGGLAGGGARAAGHMKDITNLVGSLFVQAGLPEDSIVLEPFLPGYYRVRKRWDMAVIYKGALVGALEFKSQVGSVGKNINNRFEEALGTASDTWAAQRLNESYGDIPPWLGYVFVLQESAETEVIDRNVTALFPTDSVFAGKRYQEMIRRFIGGNIYQAGWFLTTQVEADGTFSYKQPLATATGKSFKVAIQGRVDFVRSIVDA